MSKDKSKKKQPPQKEGSNNQVADAGTVSSINKENSKVESNDTKKEIIKPIVDRFDFQLLITIIIFFVSAWAYLNGVICDFTDSTPYVQQMSYIFVHYVLTIMLIYSVVLSAMKSFYLINETKNNYSKWFNLFLDSWFWIPLICLLAILLFKAFPNTWLFFSVAISVLIIKKMTDLKFSKLLIGASIPILIFGFYLFISIMTFSIVNVKAETDKPFYSISDTVLITVSARGYACKHKLVGVGENIKCPKEFSDKGLLVIDASHIINNEISIGTISPMTGKDNFYRYGLYKIFDRELPFINIDENDIVAIKQNAHFTPISIYVKPN